MRASAVVTSRKGKDKNWQEMIAEGGTEIVEFQTDELWGTAKTVKYDEEKEIIIFEGTPAIIHKRDLFRVGPLD